MEFDAVADAVRLSNSSEAQAAERVSDYHSFCQPGGVARIAAMKTTFSVRRLCFPKTLHWQGPFLTAFFSGRFWGAAPPVCGDGAR